MALIILTEKRRSKCVTCRIIFTLTFATGVTNAALALVVALLSMTTRFHAAAADNVKWMLQGGRERERLKRGRTVFYNQQSIKAIVYVVGMNLIALAESGQIVRMEHWMHATDCSIGVNGLQYRMSSLPVLF